MPDPNRQSLERVAKVLGQELLDELCLVGGCAARPLVTDPASEPVRPTIDVDVIADVPTYAAHKALESRIEMLGFQEGSREGDPTCRLRRGECVLDLMPVEDNGLQSTNPWYASAMGNRWEATLDNGLRIRVIDAPHFLATKLEAYTGRGEGDPVMGHDLEDLVRVVDGRPEIVDDMGRAPDEVRHAVEQRISVVLQDAHFREAIPGSFESGWDRLEILLGRLEAIQGLAGC